MRFEDAARALDGIPNMTAEQGKTVYDHIVAERITSVLELGTANGTSACYMGAAVQEVGKGSVVTIDREIALTRKPNVLELVERVGLSDVVRPILTPSSYNWELMKMIEENTRLGSCNPIFGFCYLDGAHTWEVDGLAFFLVEKLLRPGGWILFDDLLWSFQRSRSLRETDWVKQMTEEERTIPQVERIFSLLVRQHPGFVNLRKDSQTGWAWAQKRDKGTGRIMPRLLRSGRKPVNTTD